MCVLLALASYIKTHGRHFESLYRNMELARKFYAIIAICGSLAVLFLVIGLISPAWIVVNVEGNNVKGYATIGLFSVKACADKPVSMCKSMSYGEIDEQLSANMEISKGEYFPYCRT